MPIIVGVIEMEFSFGDHLRNVLETVNWNQEDLKRATGIGKSTMNKLVSQDANPELVTILTICKGLNMSIAEFFAVGANYPKLDYSITDNNITLLELTRGYKPEDWKYLIKMVRLYNETR